MTASAASDQHGREGTELPPAHTKSILVVSDTLAVAEGHARAFEQLDYRLVRSAPTRFATQFAADMDPDAIIILGHRRRDADLAVLVGRLREVTGAVIIIASGADAPGETVRCFQAGADEILMGRVTPVELDLRIRAFFRRLATPLHAEPLENPDEPIDVGPLRIDRAGQRVTKDGEIISLSPTEFRLLLTLAENRGIVVPARTLISRVWGPEYEDETHYLRLYIRYLRQKIEDDPAKPVYILNRRGSGYAFDLPPVDMRRASQA